MARPLRFKMTDEAWETIENIRSLLEVECGRKISNAQLIRSSLRLTRWYLEKVVLEGKKIGLISDEPDGSVREVHLKFFSGRSER